MLHKQERKILRYIGRRALLALPFVAATGSPVLIGFAVGSLLWPEHWRHAALWGAITLGVVGAISVLVGVANYDANRDDLKKEWAKEAERPEGMPDYH